jgi:hypothetical protein
LRVWQAHDREADEDHHPGFDARELTEYRTTMYRNVLSYAGTLARVLHRMGVGTLEESARTPLSCSRSFLWKAVQVRPW